MSEACDFVDCSYPNCACNNPPRVVPNLHPDTEKLIAEGPRWANGDCESYADFARRIALHAVEKEQERMVVAVADELVQGGSMWTPQRAVAFVERVIRRRGEP